MCSAQNYNIIITAGRVVDAEPEQPADRLREARAALRDEVPRGHVVADRALVHVRGRLREKSDKRNNNASSRTVN